MSAYGLVVSEAETILEMACAEKGGIAVKGSKLLIMVALAVIAAFGAQSALGHGDVRASTTGSGTMCNSLVILNASDVQQMKEAEQVIKSSGGYVAFRFPPHVFYAWLPEGVAEDIAGRAHIDSIYSSSLQPDAVLKFGRSAVSAVKSWNAVFIAQSTSYDPHLAQEPSGIYNDALEVPAEGRLTGYRSHNQSRLVSGPSGRGSEDTSEFMLGNVAIAIILPESDGSIDTETEDWTNEDTTNSIQDRPQKIKNEVIAALNWWVLRETEQRSGPPLLSFTLDPSSPRVRITGYEPITRSSADEHLWVSQIFTQMGYLTGTAWEKVRQFDHDLIDDFGADWAVTIFVCDSLNDSDGTFADGAFGYSYLGGPWLTMTYDNNGYTIHWMDAVGAHELGHSFYTLDEYPPGSGTPTDCHAFSGYLNSENLNSLYDPGMTGTCDANYGCIMRGGTTAFRRNELCPYSASHVGWADTDLDGVYDILDFCPHSELYDPDEDPTDNTRPTFTGKCWVDLDTDVLVNDNPRDPGNDYTINVISKAEYRYQNLAGGAPSDWFACVPDDGAFDGIEERFHFTVGRDLEDGTYLFEVRATTLGGHVQGVGDCIIDPEAQKNLTIMTGPQSGQDDENPPECHTPYPPCYGLSQSGPCYIETPTIQPTPDWATSRTVLIGCTFTDRSWVDASSVQYRIDANGDYDYNDWGFDEYGNFWTEDWTTWDVEMPPKSDSRNLRAYAIVTYQADGPDLHYEWRASDISMAFDETNGYTYSGRLNRKGMMDDWILRIDSKPPQIISAAAADTSGQGAGIQEGDTVTIRFDEETNGPWINETNIDQVLYIVDDSYSPPRQHTWGNCQGLVKDITWSQTKWPNDTIIITLYGEERCPGRVWKPDVSVGDLLCIMQFPTGEYIEDIANNRCTDCIYITGSFADSGGPVVTSLLANGISPLQVGVGTPQVDITATLSDATTGNSNITKVELFVNLAGASETGTKMAMTPSYPPGDITVDATFTLPTFSWSTGTYTVFVHGKDEAGFWGEFETVKIYVGQESIGCLYAPEFDGISHAVDLRTCGEVMLDWEEAVDINQPVVYNIYQSRVDALYDFASPSYTTEDLSIAVSRLENNLPYYFVVRAEDSCGNEERNFVQLQVYPSDNEPPHFEGIQEVVSTGCAALELIWTPATDDLHGCSSEPVSYNIYLSSQRKGQDFRFPSLRTTADDGIILTNLQHDAEYFIVVRAEDSAADYTGEITGFETSTVGGDFDIMVDSSAEWRENVLVGSQLQPNITRRDTYMIVANSMTTVTITSGYDLMEAEATVGSIYWIKGAGNEDDNKVELSATADYIKSNDEEHWWIENQVPASGATVYNVDHLEFDILDDCFGVNKNSIQLVLGTNQTENALITEIWGGYHVEFYPGYVFYDPPDMPYFAGDITVTVVATEHSDTPWFDAEIYTFTALMRLESEE